MSTEFYRNEKERARGTLGVCVWIEKGFMGDPRAFFFFRVMTGGGARSTGF